MKLRLSLLKASALIVAMLFSATAFNADAQNLKNLLSGLTSGTGSGSSDSTSTSSTSSGALGDLLSAVGKTVGADVKYSALTGTWDYTGAAVGFQSDNLLKKAGGAAAATALEKKITPYYEKAGLTSVKIAFKSDSTFTFTFRKVNLSGTVTKGDTKGCYVFHFKALGKVNLGKINGYVVSEGVNTISLTFDASKLITLVDKVAKISGNSSIKAVSSMLTAYDGCTIGFKMKKTAKEQ